MNEFGSARAGVAQGVIPRTGESEDSSFVNGDIIVADGGWTSAF